MTEEYNQAKATAEEAEMARALLERENKDLGLQIQHMLRQQQQAMYDRAGGGSALEAKTSSSSGVGSPGAGAAGGESDHFLLYADVSELQGKNEHLLRVVRSWSWSVTTWWRSCRGTASTQTAPSRTARWRSSTRCCPSYLR